MNILLISISAYPTIGGVENSLNFIAEELYKRGDKVIVVSFKQNIDTPKYFSHKNIEHIKIPLKGVKFSYFFRMLAVIKSLKKYIPTILNEYSIQEIWSRSTIVSYALLKINSPSIKQIFSTTARLHCSGTYFSRDKYSLKIKLKNLIYYSIDFPVFFFIEKKVVRKVESYVFSDLMKSELKKDYGSSVKFVNVVRPGVDKDFFSLQRGQELRKYLFEEYPFLDNKYFLYVGRMSYAKNVDFLLEAYSLSQTKIKLVLVGDGSNISYLKQKAIDLGISYKTYFVGKQTTLLPAFYAQAFYTIMPTTIETFGQTILESMACGTKVLGFGTNKENNKKIKTAINEIIEHNITGYIMNEISLNSFSDAIIKISTESKFHIPDKFLDAYEWKDFVNKMKCL